MEVQRDFKELLALFNAHQVDYIVVGGYALAYHGAPRFTGYLDILVKPHHQNAQKILTALNSFGFQSAGLTPKDFQQPDVVIQLGVPPVRIDIMTTLTGVSWDEAYSNRVADLYGDVEIYCIGREQLVTNKRILGRKRDLADLEALGED